jgi:hypothetical protein
MFGIFNPSPQGWGVKNFFLKSFCGRFGVVRHIGFDYE